MEKVRVKHLHHSSFLVEIYDAVFIFDFWKGRKSGKQSPEKIFMPENFKDKKNIFVFASHHHHDHFDPVIFSWKKALPQIQYFLSYDIESHCISRKDIGSNNDNIHFIRPHKEYSFGDLTVRALKSTDEGVAFLVDYKGFVLYHAGDLHWWYWHGEPDDWNKNMELAFKSEVSLLKGYRIDIAFLPADPRQEDAGLWGMIYFLENVDVKTAYPMHFWDDTKILHRIKEEAGNHPVLNKVIIPANNQKN